MHKEKAMPLQPLEKTSDNPTSKTSFINLAKEMRDLGMDPQPLFEIAANDLFSRHGPKALNYAETLLKQMREQGNPDGIYLWKSLYSLLKMRLSGTLMMVH